MNRENIWFIVLCYSLKLRWGNGGEMIKEKGCVFVIIVSEFGIVIGDVVLIIIKVNFC